MGGAEMKIIRPAFNGKSQTLGDEDWGQDWGDSTLPDMSSADGYDPNFDYEGFFEEIEGAQNQATYDQVTDDINQDFYDMWGSEGAALFDEFSTSYDPDTGMLIVGGGGGGGSQSRGSGGGSQQRGGQQSQQKPQQQQQRTPTQSQQRPGSQTAMPQTPGMSIAIGALGAALAALVLKG